MGLHLLMFWNIVSLGLFLHSTWFEFNILGLFIGKQCWWALLSLCALQMPKKKKKNCYFFNKYVKIIFILFKKGID